MSLLTTSGNRGVSKSPSPRRRHWWWRPLQMGWRFGLMYVCSLLLYRASSPISDNWMPLSEPSVLRLVPTLSTAQSISDSPSSTFARSKLTGKPSKRFDANPPPAPTPSPEPKAQPFALVSSGSKRDEILHSADGWV